MYSYLAALLIYKFFLLLTFFWYAEIVTWRDAFNGYCSRINQNISGAPTEFETNTGHMPCMSCRRAAIESDDYSGLEGLIEGTAQEIIDLEIGFWIKLVDYLKWFRVSIISSWCLCDERSEREKNSFSYLPSSIQPFYRVARLDINMLS